MDGSSIVFYDDMDPRCHLIGLEVVMCFIVHFSCGFCYFGIVMAC